MKQIIEVKKIGDDPGFCSEYFKSLSGRRGFVKVTHPKTKEVSWYTTNNKNFEPECPINSENWDFREEWNK